MRWLDELMNPAAKCSRVGHKVHATQKLCYLYPSSMPYSCVADSAYETTLKCSRCDEVLDVSMTRPKMLNGLTLDTVKWDELKKNGIVKFAA